MQHPEGRFAKRLGNRQLVHLFVVTLLQVDNLALARAADQNHREAVGGGIGQRCQAIEKARGRNRQANARLLRQETSRRGSIAGVLLVTKRNHAYAGRLRLAREVGDRDARQGKNRVNVVEFQGINDETKAVSLFLSCCFVGHEARSLFCRRSGLAAHVGKPAVTGSERVTFHMALS